MQRDPHAYSTAGLGSSATSAATRDAYSSIAAAGLHPGSSSALQSGISGLSASSLQAAALSTSGLSGAGVSGLRGDEGKLYTSSARRAGLGTDRLGALSAGGRLSTDRLGALSAGGRI